MHFGVFADGDGFGADFDIRVSKKTWDHLLCNVYPQISAQQTGLLNKIEEIREEKNLILNFDPDKLVKKIDETNAGVEKIRQHIKSNDLLQSLGKPLDEMTHYLKEIEKVTSTYSAVYLHIIKPIQKEGQQSLKATARWAIISIITSSIISVVITNWLDISSKFSTIIK